MVRSRLGFKVLGLCALALALTAFITSAAQAEAGASWKVNGTSISSTLLPPFQVKELENKTASLLFTTAGGTKVEILCTAAKVLDGLTTNDAKLGFEGKVDLGRAHFTGCLTKLNGTTSPPCEPHSGAFKGLILTEAVSGLIRLHPAGGQPVVELRPNKEGGNFVTMEMGEECAIGEKVPVAGVLFLKDCKNEGKVELVEHLIEELKELTKLTALGQPATLDGSALIKLTGAAHVGLKFSGIPG